MPESVTSLESLLRAATGGLVFGFSDYAAARAAIGRGHAQALVVDAGANEAPGLDLIREARASASSARVFIVGTTTGVWQHTEPPALYEAGADVVLTKPFAFGDLLTALGKGLTLAAAPDIILLSTSAESQSLDYKERVLLSSADERAAIAKDIIAMANYGGGTIIVGVAEPTPGRFIQLGVPTHELGSYEVTVVNKAIRDFMTPHVAVQVRFVTHQRRSFVVIDVPAADTIVLAARNNDAAKLFQGRVYSRSSAVESAEIRTAAEMRAIIDRLRATKKGSG